MGENIGILWPGIMQHYRTGKRIEKDEIVAALDSGEDVPIGANAFLQKVITGKYRFKRGNKPDGRFDTFAARRTVAKNVTSLEKDHGMSRTEAKKTVAASLSISVRLLERVIATIPKQSYGRRHVLSDKNIVVTRDGKPVYVKDTLKDSKGEEKK